MKNLLKSYYELTVIPSIVLGCITTIGWYVFHWANEGIAYTTPGEVSFSFIFFFIIMTMEDAFKIMISNLRNQK